MPERALTRRSRRNPAELGISTQTHPLGLYVADIACPPSWTWTCSTRTFCWRLPRRYFRRHARAIGLRGFRLGR